MPGRTCFRFGAVLYEMATGKLPFEGGSSGEIFGAILRDEPAMPSQLNPQVSSGLEAVIGKALEKDRNLRYQHATDMRTDLQRLKRDSESGRYSAAKSGAVAASGASAIKSGGHAVEPYRSSCSAKETMALHRCGGGFTDCGFGQWRTVLPLASEQAAYRQRHDRRRGLREQDRRSGV